MRNKIKLPFGKFTILFFTTLLAIEFTQSLHSLKYLQGQVPQDTACWLLAIGRGAGRQAQDKSLCRQNEEFVNEKCYFKCPMDLVGKGPVCWAKCKEPYEQCGAICVKNQVCSGRIKDYVEKMSEIAETYANEKAILGEIDLEKLSNEFTFSKCK